MQGIKKGSGEKISLPALTSAGGLKMRYRLGVDVEGTFTDLLLFSEETGRAVLAKVPLCVRR